MKLTQIKNTMPPIGTIIDCLNNLPNSNWIKADGSEISREEYSDLFDIYGISFGAGDGSTTFKIPDLRGLTRAGAQDDDSNSNSRFSQPLGFAGLTDEQKKTIGTKFGKGYVPAAEAEVTSSSRRAGIDVSSSDTIVDSEGAYHRVSVFQPTILVNPYILARY